MRRGTTPTVTLAVDDDIHDWTTFVSMRCKGITKTLKPERLTMSYADGTTTIVFTLTQQETLWLSEPHVDIQVRATKGDQAVATTIERVSVGGVLMGGVIHG